MKLEPPTGAALARNARLLIEEFRAADALLRYFIVSQLLSGVLLGLCSIASIVAGIAGLAPANLVLLGAATLCLVHCVTTWNILKRRYHVRYEMW